MARYRWPTDPKGAAPAHSMPYSVHQAPKALRGARISGKQLTQRQYDRGDWLRALLGQKPGTPLPSPRPPAAPAAPAAPAPAAGAPVDPAYLQQMETLARTRDQALGDVRGARQQGLLGYGYNEGVGGALAFDPLNPFSKASLLKRNYDVSRQRTGNQMAASGQLYAGAYQTSQDSLNRGQIQSEDTLQKSLQDFLARNTSQAGQAQSNYQFGAAQAEGDRVGRIDTNPLYEPTATPADVQTAAAGASKGAVITNSLGHKGRWVTRPDGTRYFKRI